MTIIQAIILGIVQGLTEFLPISSSGHLVALPYILNWDLPADQMFVFDILVQVGTLAAVIVYFWKDLVAIIKAFFQGIFSGKPFASHEARLGWMLIVATIPAGLAALFLKDLVEQAFSSPLATGIALLVTALMMWIGERVSKKMGDLDGINFGTALVMGLMQILALFPGVSRSGSTMSGGLFRNLKRESAGKFSFLMSIPIMLAAGVYSTYQMVTEVPDVMSFLPIMAVGFLTAAIVGYLSIRWLLKFLVNHSLATFSIYCAALGSFLILMSWLR
jgi:undecaprenyl-diphosphatase